VARRKGELGREGGREGGGGRIGESFENADSLKRLREGGREGRALPGVEGDGEELAHGHGLLSQLARGNAGVARVVLKEGREEGREGGTGETVRKRMIRRRNRGTLNTAGGRKGGEGEREGRRTQSLTVLSMPQVAMRPGARGEKAKEEQVLAWAFSFQRGAAGDLKRREGGTEDKDEYRRRRSRSWRGPSASTGGRQGC